MEHRATGYLDSGTPAGAADSSDARFRSLFENNHTVMLILDPASRAIVDANPAAASFYGRTREELTHMTIDGLSTSTLGELQNSLRLALHSSSSAIVARHRAADGAVRDVEIHNGPFPVGDRALVYAMVHDVTARRASEAALRLQSAALNAAGSAMVITDRDGGILWVNPAFTELTGYTAVEAIGLNPRELLKSGVHDDGLYADLWNTVTAGRVWNGEMTNRRKDGTLYSEMQTITPVKDPNGVITNFIAIKRDLTELKALEAQFLQSQKMEVVGRLAGGIAHDFNNLLTVINMTSELAADTLRQGDPLRTDFEEIGRAGQRAAALTRQLLAFSRRQILVLEVVNVFELIESMANMLQRLIGEDIHLVVAPPAPLRAVKADRSQLEQVVLNLAVNARDAMPDGGTLTLRIDNAVAGNTPQVVLTVTDTGSGMDAATRQRIFEPFFTTKEPGKGTGLGLSTVYGIVKQSGGTIAVESEPGAGATFRVSLPHVVESEIAASSRRTAPAGRDVGTLLLVEDERALSALASRMLKSAGYTVMTCASGEEALALLERHDRHVDLMITDVVMPGISGRELAQRLAALRPLTRVLFTSGYTDDAILRHGLLDDGSNFIPKPYTRAGLIAKVREILAAPAGDAP